MLHASLSVRNSTVEVLFFALGDTRKIHGGGQVMGVIKTLSIVVHPCVRD